MTKKAKPLVLFASLPLLASFGDQEVGGGFSIGIQPARKRTRTGQR